MSAYRVKAQGGKNNYKDYILKRKNSNRKFSVGARFVFKEVRYSRKSQIYIGKREELTSCHYQSKLSLKIVKGKS